MPTIVVDVMPKAELPDLKTPHEGPPPARSWPESEPAAAARLSAARTAVTSASSIIEKLA